MLIRLHRRAAPAALGAALAALAVVAACYPGITDSRSADTVTTVHAPDAAFGTALTYVVPDSVVHIVAEGEEDDIPRTVDDAILTSIRQNMNARGYTESTDPLTTRPDFAVTAAATTTTNLVYYYYDFWSYWGCTPTGPATAGGGGITTRATCPCPTCTRPARCSSR